MKTIIINHNQKPIKSKHITTFVSPSGGYKDPFNSFDVIVVEENHYLRPDCPEHATIPIIEERVARTISSGNELAACIIYFHGQNAINDLVKNRKE